MPPTDPKAEALVDEGLALYSQGILDEALAKWHEALAIDPRADRAHEYIQYVSENRAALDQSFNPGASQHDSGTADRFAAVEAAPVRALEFEPQTGGEFLDEVAAPAVGETTDDGITSRIELDDYRDEIERSRKRTPLSLVEGGGELPSDFEPFEPTPVGVSLPEPAHLVPETAFGGSVHDLSSDAKTPTSMRDRKPLDALPALDQLPTLDVPPVNNGPVELDLDLSESEPTQPPAAPLKRTLTEQGEAAASEALNNAGESVESMMTGAWQLYEQGTYEGSLWLCQRVVATDASHPEATALLARNEQALLAQYERQLGDLEKVPVVQVPQHEIVWHKLDHRAGFLLSRIDGMLSYTELLDVSGMSHFETCRILAQLLDQGVIGVGR